MRRIRWPPVNSPHKSQWRGAMMFSLICAWTKISANNRDTGDLRPHPAHRDVTVVGLLPDTQSCGLRMRREFRERFPATDFKGHRGLAIRHPSRHVRHARAVIYVGIANPRWRKNVPCIPGACATLNFTYLVRGPWLTRVQYVEQLTIPPQVLSICVNRSSRIHVTEERPQLSTMSDEWVISTL